MHRAIPKIPSWKPKFSKQHQITEEFTLKLAERAHLSINDEIKEFRQEIANFSGIIDFQENDLCNDKKTSESGSISYLKVGELKRKTKQELLAKAGFFASKSS
jgi:acetylglutamate kinase